MKKVIVSAFLLSNILFANAQDPYEKFLERVDVKLKKSEEDKNPLHLKTAQNLQPIEGEEEKIRKEMQKEVLKLNQLTELEQKKKQFNKISPIVKTDLLLKIKTKLTYEMKKYPLTLEIDDFSLLKNDKELVAYVSVKKINEIKEELKLRKKRHQELSSEIAQIDDFSKTKDSDFLTERISNLINKNYENSSNNKFNLKNETQVNTIIKDRTIKIKEKQWLSSDIQVKEINQNLIIIGIQP